MEWYERRICQGYFGTTHSGMWKWVSVGLPYLEPDLLIDSDWPVSEGDAIAEAGNSAHVALHLVHHDLRAFCVGMETERRGGWQLLAHAHLQGVAAKGSSVWEIDKKVIYIFNRHSPQCTFWQALLFSLRALCCFHRTEGGQLLPSLNENLYQD